MVSVGILVAGAIAPEAVPRPLIFGCASTAELTHDGVLIGRAAYRRNQSS
ncbi:hypothetical protein [Mycobacterium riyadhense]|nr:hypothetical protein [Mycobacterium riyadhense]